MSAHKKATARPPRGPTLGTVAVPKTPSGAQGLPQPHFPWSCPCCGSAASAPSIPACPCRVVCVCRMCCTFQCVSLSGWGFTALLPCFGFFSHFFFGMCAHFRNGRAEGSAQCRCPGIAKGDGGRGGSLSPGVSAVGFPTAAGSVRFLEPYGCSSSLGGGRDWCWAASLQHHPFQ